MNLNELLKPLCVSSFSLLFHVDYNSGDISTPTSSPGWHDTRFDWWGNISVVYPPGWVQRTQKKKKNSGDIWLFCIHECLLQTMVLLEDMMNKSGLKYFNHLWQAPVEALLQKTDWYSSKEIKRTEGESKITVR